MIKSSGLLIASVDVESEGSKKKTNSTLPAWAFNVLALILVISSFFLYQGYSYGQQAVSYIHRQDIVKAKQAFEKASKYDPFTSSFKADLAQLEEVIGNQTENEAMIEKGQEYRLAAIELDPYNAKLQTQLAKAYLAKGELEEGLKALEKATELNPHNISLWEDLADACEKVAEVYIRQDKRDEALRAIDKSQGIFNKIAQLNLKTPKDARQKLEISNDLMLYVYKAKLLAENIDDKDYYKKLDHLVFVSDLTLDTDHNGVPDLWNTLNSRQGYIKTDVTKEYTVITNEGEGISYLLTKQDFSLEPETSYTIKMLASGDIPKDKLVFNIYSREGKSPQYQWKDIELSPDMSNIATSFTTSEDLVEGKQWLRMHISPVPEKHMNINSIEIWEAEF